MELKQDKIVSQLLATPTNQQIKMFSPLWIPFHSFSICRAHCFPILATGGGGVDAILYPDLVT